MTELEDTPREGAICESRYEAATGSITPARKAGAGRSEKRNCHVYSGPARDRSLRHYAIGRAGMAAESLLYTTHCLKSGDAAPLSYLARDRKPDHLQKTDIHCKTRLGYTSHDVCSVELQTNKRAFSCFGRWTPCGQGKIRGSPTLQICRPRGSKLVHKNTHRPQKTKVSHAFISDPPAELPNRIPDGLDHPARELLAGPSGHATSNRRPPADLWGAPAHPHPTSAVFWPSRCESPAGAAARARAPTKRPAPIAVS